MIAAELSAGLVVLGLLVIATTALLSTVSLPRHRWYRRRPTSPRPPLMRPQPAPAREERARVTAQHRRVVTGRPAAIPPIEVGPGRQTPTLTDDQVRRHDVDAAEAFVEHLLDTDPEQLADVLSNLINQPDQNARAPRRP